MVLPEAESERDAEGRERDDDPGAELVEMLDDR
jgi:hypothetical protein